MTRPSWIARAFLLALMLGTSAGFASAQDSSRVTSDSVRPEKKPPLSPRRAFLSSLVIPGYSQSVLGRRKSGAMILAFEAVSVIMIRESALGVREAKRLAKDSVVASYVDASGAAITRFERTNFPRSLIRSRKEHLEDWIAVLVANHLFSGADAFVGSLLWDLPAEVSAQGGRGSGALRVSFRF